MKKKVALVMVPVLGILLFGASSVSAFGFGRFSQGTPAEVATRQQEMFTQHASVLGISVDQVKAYWAQGKNVREIATTVGITDEQLQAKMQTLRQTEMKEHLSTLVSQGVITQAQADSRLSYMASNTGGKGAGGMGFGKGKGVRGGRGMMNAPTTTQ